MIGIYLSHPQVEIDPAVPVPDWHLSEMGRARIEAVKERSWVAGIERFVSSPERKAQETVRILATPGGRSVETLPGSDENDRSATGFLPPNRFEVAADRFFAEPEASWQGWERAIDAQSRIVGAIRSVLHDHDPSRPILFVGHGAVGTLLKCHLAGRPIARREDQPNGGGNLFVFALADRRLLCDWTSIENFEGMTA